MNPSTVSRNPSGYLRLLKEQYDLLKDAVDDFYMGKEARANDAAVRIRTLIHSTAQSTALLSLIAPNYMDLLIYNRANKADDNPKAVFVLKHPIEMTGDGKTRFIRDDFANPDYSLVPLQRWWTDEYLRIGSVRSSKRQVVLDVSNKDGGAHVDPDVPTRHAAASEPPLVFGLNEHAFRPNLARATVAQAGNELLEYLERNFLNVKEAQHMDAKDERNEKPQAKAGHTILFRDGTHTKISSTEQGIAFYGVSGHVPIQNLIPAANGLEDCWEVDASLP